jgi:hypothetical protein
MKINNLGIDNNLPEINSTFFHSLKGNQPPVLVVGMHNSGTSILTEILHKNGIFFGANMHHFESNFFSIFINDRIILGGKGNWAQLPIMSVDQVLSLESSVAPIIKAHWLADYLQWGYDGESLWGIKDPRLCILLPLYLRIFPDAKVIHIRRNPNDVAASLTGKYKAGVGILDNFNHWKTLTEAYTKRVLDFKDQCASYYEISYEDLCTHPVNQTTELFKFLSIPFTSKTEELLAKVSTDRIGSFERWQEFQKYPLRSKLKSLFGIQS